MKVVFKKGLFASLPTTGAAGLLCFATDAGVIRFFTAENVYTDVDGRITKDQFDALVAALGNDTTVGTILYRLKALENFDAGIATQITEAVNALANGAVQTNTNAIAAIKDSQTIDSFKDVEDALAGKQAVGDYATKAEAQAMADDKDEAIAAAKKAGDDAAAALGEYKTSNDVAVKSAQDDVDALEAYVGTIPEGYIEENVISYINKKAEETLASATGGSSESAASVLAALNTYKAENNPKVAANTAAAKAADDKAVAAQGEIDALEAKVGEVTDGKTVVEMINDAKVAATYDDSALKARVEANEGEIATLKGDAETAGSVDYKIAQAVAAIMENPDDTMNSINELVTWCNDHAADALELSNKVSANESDIAALEGLVGSTAVATQITDAIAAALKIEGVDKYALATDLTAAIGRIAAMEAKVADWDDAVAKEHEHANKELLDTYTQTEADLADAVAKKHEHANKAELDKIVAGDKAKWDAAQANAEKTAADALSAAKTELEGKISAAQTAAEKVANDNNTAMDTRVKVLEAIDHEAYKAYADQAEVDAVATANAYATGLLEWQSF